MRRPAALLLDEPAALLLAAVTEYQAAASQPAALLLAAVTEYQAAASRLDAAVREALEDDCPVIWMSERLGCSPTTVTAIKRTRRPDRWGMPQRIYDSAPTASPSWRASRRRPA